MSTFWEALLSVNTAAWMQGIGSVTAIAASAWLAGRQSREARDREERDRAEGRAQEVRAAAANREAAYGLAQIAARRIRSLADLLKDQANWDIPDKLSYVSKSLELADRNFAGFPMHTLGDAATIEILSRFPGMLMLAQEYFNDAHGLMNDYAQIENPEAAKASILAGVENLARMAQADASRLKAQEDLSE
jgi:hypothetical protein